METKKSSKANLEKQKTMGGLMGLVVALAVLFVGFEWGANVDLEKIVRPYDPSNTDELFPPISFPEPPPPPPPPPSAQMPEIINVVDNGAEPDLDPGFTSEVTPETTSPTMPPPPLDNDVEKPEGNEVFIVVETMPAFPGGDVALMKFIANSIKYPEQAIEKGVSGSVVCSFIIDKDGTITDAEVVKGIDYSLDKEALRVINSMPKWSPGMQRDKPVRVKYTIPIRFRLQQQ